MYGKLRENKILHHLINTRDWSLIWLYTRLQLFWKQSLHRSEIGFHLSRAKMVSFRPLHPLSYRSVCYGYIDWYFMQRYCLVMFCRVWTESHCANGPGLPLSVGFPNASGLGSLSRFTLGKMFLGPRGPLRTPLVPVVRCPVPSSATKIHATSHYSFSDSKLILFHIQTLSSRNLSNSTQYTEHWTGSCRGPF